MRLACLCLLLASLWALSSCSDNRSATDLHAVGADASPTNGDADAASEPDGMRSGSGEVVATPPDAGTDAGAAPLACGRRGQPLCPLQAWMRASMETPLMRHDLATLEASFTECARFVPDPTWNDGADGWATIAAAGAAAAGAGNETAAKGECTRCHTTWRSAYQRSYRSDPLPE